MAVLLEGIDIPEWCSTLIIIYKDGTWVNAYTTEEGNAIEVPEPHGRLGDLDALMGRIEHDTPLSSTFEKIVRRYIENAPTIIPAETTLENEIKIIDTKGKPNYNPKHRFIIPAREKEE